MLRGYEDVLQKTLLIPGYVILLNRDRDVPSL
jgi:hypothetical protein